MTGPEAALYAFGCVVGAAFAASHADALRDVHPQARASAVRQVDIRGFAYAPARLEVIAGDTIVWTNRDAVPHTATAVDDAWDTGNLDAQRRGRFVASRPGEYEYYCVYHPAMKGRISVKSAR